MGKIEPFDIRFMGYPDSGKTSLVAAVKKHSSGESRTDIETIIHDSLDCYSDERTKETTIFESKIEFEYKGRSFDLLDSPKRQIMGSLRADVTIIVVNAEEGLEYYRDESDEPNYECFPTSVENYSSSTKDINRVIIVINKMDLVNYSENRYKSLKSQIKDELDIKGHDDSSITFIPVSATEEDNIEKNENMPWYDGLNLLEVISKLKKPHYNKEKTRVEINEINSEEGEIIAYIKTGYISVGDKVIIEPANTREPKSIKGSINALSIQGSEIEVAEPENYIEIEIENVNIEDIREGDIISDLENPPTVKTKFKAEIKVGGRNKNYQISKGSKLIIELNELKVDAEIENISEIKDDTKKISIKNNPDKIKDGQRGTATIKTEEPVVISDKSKKLCGFIMRKDGDMIGHGKCTKIVEYV